MDETRERSAGEKATGKGNPVAKDWAKQEAVAREAERVTELALEAKAGEELSTGERVTRGWQAQEEWQGKRWQAGEAILGRYVVEGELGQGGMGVVYGCLDTDTRENRLLGWRKTLGISLVSENGGILGAEWERMTVNGKGFPQEAGQGQAESQVTSDKMRVERLRS